MIILTFILREQIYTNLSSLILLSIRSIKILLYIMIMYSSPRVSGFLWAFHCIQRDSPHTSSGFCKSSRCVGRSCVCWQHLFSWHLILISFLNGVLSQLISEIHHLVIYRITSDFCYLLQSKHYLTFTCVRKELTL